MLKAVFQSDITLVLVGEYLGTGLNVVDNYLLENLFLRVFGENNSRYLRLPIHQSYQDVLISNTSTHIALFIPMPVTVLSTKV